MGSPSQVLPPTLARLQYPAPSDMADFQAEQFEKYDMEQYQKYDTEFCNFYTTSLTSRINKNPVGVQSLAMAPAIHSACLFSRTGEARAVK